MKAPAFDYARPATLEEAFQLLQAHGDNARILAGGQTLLATLNMRLSEPALLVDITGIPGLRGIALKGERLSIRALTTHTEIERSPLVATHAPLLRMAAPHIAHRAIRNMGTLGGSLAYADPAAEWPACALALDAHMVLASSQGERRIAAADFFTDVLTTAMQPGEILVACEIAACGKGWVYGFDELARRHGDYAIAGLALALKLEGRQVAEARIALLGVAGTPMRAHAAEASLAGKPLDHDSIEAAASALAGELDGDHAPMGDLTNSPATKRHLATVLLRRLLARAIA